MDVKYVAFLAACMIALLFLERSDEPQVDQEKTVSPNERARTAEDSILDDLYQLEN
jgi:hypothetical protein